MEWTPLEQKALEAAMRTHREKGDERWDKIANDVPGKSKKECIARVKMIKQALAKKEGPAEPKQLPRLFMQMTKYLSVSRWQPGPTIFCHQPGSGYLSVDVR